MAKEPEPSFEQALTQLEQIVGGLERGEAELSSALAKYEKGVLLLTQCHKLLEKAEQSVALLMGVDESGKPITAPFDASATISRDAPGVDAAIGSVPPSPPKKRRVSDRTSTSATPAPGPSESPTDSDPPF
jgi:exodeoxyribonuclease VII small subunit